MEWWAGGLLGGEANNMDDGLNLILSMCGYVCVRVQKATGVRQNLRSQQSDPELKPVALPRL